jgi:hypothetical protein
VFGFGFCSLDSALRCVTLVVRKWDVPYAERVVGGIE